MEPKSVLIELHYFPCLEFFACINQFKAITLETRENYVKQTYRNRCRILGSQGVLDLTVPVKSGNKTPIREVEIDYSQKWLNNHVRSIVSCYGKAPFFPFYWDRILPVLEKKHPLLFDLNWDFFGLVLELLGVHKDVGLSETYQKEPPQDQVLDARSCILTSQKSRTTFYQPCTYNQIFGEKFVQNLSILDLLFCEGPGSVTILSKSGIKRNKT